MIRKTYRAGGLTLCLESDEPILDADFFPLFRAEDAAAPDLTVRVLRQPLPAPDGAPMRFTGHRGRRAADGRTFDYTCFSDTQRQGHTPYACAVREEDGGVTLYVDYDARLWDTMVFDAVGLPDLFLEKGAAIVHASFIGLGADGVLFAGPKQQGKSTQARLWEACRNAVVINGDRAAVRETADGFTAYGVPFCGSSKVCLNESRRIRAIVFPEKGTENTASRISAIEAFKRLIGCLSYTESDPAAQENAVRAAERLAAGVPCFLLVCRPEPGAVETLADALHLKES